MTTAWGGQPPNLTSSTQTHWGAESIGILGSVMKAAWTTGEHGASPLANDNLSDSSEYRWYVENAQSGCTVDTTELGIAEASVTSDGSYIWTYRLIEDGVLLTRVGSVSIYVGVVPIVTGAVVGIAAVTVTATGGVTTNPVSVISAQAVGLASSSVQAQGHASVAVTDTSDSVLISKRRIKVTTKKLPTSVEYLDFQAIDDITFDYSGLLASSEVIIASETNVSVRVGSDSVPNNLIGISPVTDGTVVTQRVVGQASNVTYDLRCLASTNRGRRLVAAVILNFNRY